MGSSHRQQQALMLCLPFLILWLCASLCHSFHISSQQAFDGARISFGVSTEPSQIHGVRHSTQQFLSANDDNENSSNDSNDFMKALQSRMAQVQQSDNLLPIVVVDTMLPRQVLKIEVENDVFQALIKDRIERESPRFGMIGLATLAPTGQTIPLQNGVEVELAEAPQVVDGQGGAGSKALRVKLVGGRRFRIVQNELETNTLGGWTEARVDFLDRDTEPPEDATSLARAMQVASIITSPRASIDNSNDTNNLIEQWIALARTKEHFEGQIDQLLEDLGPPPPPTDPTDLAFWVGALINPLPGMGVAMEIRPHLLMAKTAEERIGTALRGLEGSIQNMDGRKPLSSYKKG